MGYACPVCETPHPDGEHLANHLAFTAMLGRTDHEDWLDEHAPDWNGMGPEELAVQVVEAVPETEFPQVFDDTTGGDRGHGHGNGDAHGADPAPTLEEEIAGGPNARGYGRGDRTAPDDVMREARRMTEAMLSADEEDDDGATDSDGESTADGDDER